MIFFGGGANFLHTLFQLCSTYFINREFFDLVIKSVKEKTFTEKSLEWRVTLDFTGHWIRYCCDFYSVGLITLLMFQPVSAEHMPMYNISYPLFCGAFAPKTKILLLCRPT